MSSQALSKPGSMWTDSNLENTMNWPCWPRWGTNMISELYSKLRSSRTVASHASGIVEIEVEGMVDGVERN